MSRGQVELDKLARRPLIDLSEAELVRRILLDVSRLYDFFNFVVEPAIGPPPRTGWDYLFLWEVSRQECGLAREGVPGDVDVLIIPTFHGRPRVEFSCAIEVKRLALRGPNWTKNVDRYGISQAEGLLRDGFPYVGILHLVLNNPGPAENIQMMEQLRIIGDNGECEPIGSHLFDMTGYWAAERQLRRLAARACSPQIGFNSVALSPRADAEGTMSISIGPHGVRSAQRNPNPNPNLLRGMEMLTSIMLPCAEMRPADSRRAAQKAP